MARLRHLASGIEHPLSARHLLGRAPTCVLRIEDPGVSGYHAELTWDGEAWSVQDLGSANGTTVGGHVLARGEHARLAPGIELVLAGTVRFALVDESAPTLIAIGPRGEIREATDELLSLPSDEAPELTIFRELDGRWWVEDHTATRELAELESLVAGGVSWRVLAPISVAATKEASAASLLAQQTLRFVVSRDGEHVELSLVRGSERVELPARNHQFLLLALARARLTDAANLELPEAERGWVYRDELPRMLAIEPELVHLWIHRARKQLGQAGVRDATALIERRAGGTQVRLGATAIDIVDQ